MKVELEGFDVAAWTAPAFRDLMNAIAVMHKSVSLIKVSWKLKSGAYLYEIKAADGRRWDQQLEAGADPLMTFSISDPWRLSEFQHQRAIRDALIAVSNKYGLTDFETTF